MFCIPHVGFNFCETLYSHGAVESKKFDQKKRYFMLKSFVLCYRSKVCKTEGQRREEIHSTNAVQNMFIDECKMRYIYNKSLLLMLIFFSKSWQGTFSNCHCLYMNIDYLIQYKFACVTLACSL